jgi:hypothetical protein
VQKISPPPGFDPWTVQPVASRYTDYAIPALVKKSAGIVIAEKTAKDAKKLIHVFFTHIVRLGSAESRFVTSSEALECTCKKLRLFEALRAGGA